MVDVYKKTLASDGIAGLYRGFGPSVLGIVVYRGLYFGMYDSIKPVLLVGPLEGSFIASFLLGWTVTTGAGIASYPLDTIRRRMMMTSGEVCIEFFLLKLPEIADTIHHRPSSTLLLWMLPVKSPPRRVSDPSSRVPVLTSSVVLLVLVCSPSTTRFSSSCSARPSSKWLIIAIVRECVAGEVMAVERWEAGAGESIDVRQKNDLILEHRANRVVFSFLPACTLLPASSFFPFSINCAIYRFLFICPVYSWSDRKCD